METIWAKAKAAIKERVPGHSYRMWIEPLRLQTCQADRFVLSTPNYFSKKRVHSQYGPLIEGEVCKAFGKPCRVLIEVSLQQEPTDSMEAGAERQIPPSINLQPHAGRMLRRNFTFDHFVVGGNNDFAYSAAVSMASQKNCQQNTLLLIANPGMGKSHLSQAVGHHILCEFPNERVYYITAEDFTNEVVYSYRNGSIDKFKEKYRSQCDVLLLEDIHYLTGKERTQIELSLTLDCLLNASKKLIFTSCYLPSDIPKLHDQLKSRLLSTLISNMEPPNFRTRVRILQKKSLDNGIEIPEEVTQYLAGELSENVRQLESGLIGVAAKSSLLSKPIDLKLAQSVVQNISNKSKLITIESIKKLVCKHCNISAEDLVSNSRKHSVVRPRQIAIYLSRKFTDQPLQAIGKSFNRYHATVLHSIGLVEREIRTNGTMREQIKYLCKKLDSGNFQ
jgi:chromosomal replication initiator protein